ncbi:MAG: 30S ribosomal protein S1 [Burkholderiales bacterium]|jgi:small subunit ribosomal protein S1|nr:30S ribosomal protein S1 [Burkholderiales bacterium]
MATAISSPASAENFATLFEESLARQEMRQGELITAEVTRVDYNVVVVNAGLKSESFIPIEEFKNDNGEIEVKEGDFITVAIESIEDGYGTTRLSRDKAKRLKAWQDLEIAMEEGSLVQGLVTSKVKGGLTVMMNGIRAFLPGSLVDIRPVKDTSPYENKSMEFKVIKLDKKRNNVVVSRRAVLEEGMGEDHEKLLETLTEGAIVKGVVKNITDYGAFVDLGGIDGLLHITDLAWRRVKHPSEVLTVGEEVEAKVLKFDQDKNRVSLGIKQMGDDPWDGLARRYPAGTHLFGKVTNITDYGAFVEIETGIEGLVHVSEMDWTNKNIHPTKVTQLGDEVEVMILEIDEERRRISLGMKQCKPNPWEEFSINHKKGDHVKGAIKSITDFGVFIGLPGNIDGLLHLSDLSWTLPGETVVRDYRKGQELEAVVLAIDVERERISLGIKQLEGDPFSNFIALHDKGSVVEGTVKSLDPKGAVIALSDGDVEGYLRSTELSRDRVEDIRQHLKEGSKISAMIINIDRKNRTINLSVKQKDNADENEALKRMKTENAGKNAGMTNLGALLKAKLDSKKENEQP